MQTYKDLKVWQVNQQCLKACVEVLGKLPNTIPARAISEQIFRSMASIGANLAEGYGSYEGKEYIRYANISLRSAIETDHWLTTLSNLFETIKKKILELSSLNTEVIFMLKGLIKSIEVKRENLSNNPKPLTLNPTP